MRLSTVVGSALAVLGLAVLTQPASAQNLTDVWIITPKPDIGMGFEAALRDHMQWRSQAGDPWRWSVYSIETGPDVGKYVLRSSGHSWADWDAYEEGFGPEAGLRIGAGIGPLVESVEHRIEAIDTARSRPAPNMADMTLHTVVKWYPRAGQMEKMNEMLRKFFDAIEEHDHPTYYTVVNTASGSAGPPSVQVVFHAANWAGLEDPDPSVMDIMMETYSEEEMKEIQEGFAMAVARTEDYLVRRRADLTPGGN